MASKPKTDDEQKPEDQPAPADEAGDVPERDAEAAAKGYFGETPDDADYSVGSGGR